MIADKKDVVGTLQERHAQAQNRMLPVARILAGAAPIMDKLARTEEWSRYCTYLQGVSERFAGQKQVALAKLGDPTVIDEQQVRKLRQDVFEADVWVNSLKFAVELPSAIVKGGEEAAQMVAKLEKKNEAPAQS